MQIIILLFLAIGAGCGGDDDNGTGPTTTIPASLVNLWWYHSATQDGVPISSFAEISFTDTSQIGSLTINSNATWSTTEYYNSQVVFTRGGTLAVNGDTLKATTTTENGSPVPPEQETPSLWEVTGDTLTLSYEIDMVVDTVIVIVKYLAD